MGCSCDMKGFLSYLVLWVLKQKKMSGAQIAAELEKRRGSKPSPGTIYPVLKELKENGLISSDETKEYSLTDQGERELKAACAIFCRQFHDFQEMMQCCDEDSCGIPEREE